MGDPRSGEGIQQRPSKSLRLVHVGLSLGSGAQAEKGRSTFVRGTCGQRSPSCGTPWVGRAADTPG